MGLKNSCFLKILFRWLFLIVNYIYGSIQIIKAKIISLIGIAIQLTFFSSLLLTYSLFTCSQCQEWSDSSSEDLSWPSLLVYSLSTISDSRDPRVEFTLLKSKASPFLRFSFSSSCPLLMENSSPCLWERQAVLEGEWGRGGLRSTRQHMSTSTPRGSRKLVLGLPSSRSFPVMWTGPHTAPVHSCWTLYRNAR